MKQICTSYLLFHTVYRKYFTSAVCVSKTLYPNAWPFLSVSLWEGKCIQVTLLSFEKMSVHLKNFSHFIL